MEHTLVFAPTDEDLRFEVIKKMTKGWRLANDKDPIVTQSGQFCINMVREGNECSENK